MLSKFSKPEPTLAQKAYCALRDQILSHRVKPGQRLPLRALAKSLKMSLAPVGEALHNLARDGLVVSEPGWGTRVRNLDLDGLRNLHVLRTALECEAIRQCVARAADSELDALEKEAIHLDARIIANMPPAESFELESNFHMHIAELSGVSILSETLRTNQVVRLLFHGSIIHYNTVRKPRQHIILLEAMRTRNADIAERVMREHCVRSMEMQLAHFRENAGTSRPPAD